MKTSDCPNCQIDGCERKSLISDLKAKYADVFAGFAVVKDNLHAQGFLDGLTYALDQLAQKLRDKPLTIDEAWEERAVWVEKRHIRSSILMPCVFVKKNADYVYTMDGVRFAIAQCGKTWRPWLRRPSQDDRMFAKWEDE